MKELSLEEKAKRYDEALEKARRYYDEYKTRDNILYVEDMEDMFPELKESEDEKIRKLLVEAVIQVLQDQYCSNRGVAKEKVVAWIEKEGEQKVSEYDVVKTIKERIIEHFDNHLIIDKCFSIGGLKNDILKIINEVKFAKQREKKPADIVEPKFKKGDVIRRKDGDGLEWIVEDLHNDGYYTIFNSDRDDFVYLDDNWELVEQKPAWSEEDEKRLTQVLVTLNDAYASKILLNWVESLKDRVQPQLKQEWSEEDKNAIQVLKDIVKHSNEINENIYTMPLKEKLYDWLKSIKDRVGNFDDGYKVGFSAAKHNQWKPSDEQITWLYRAADDACKDSRMKQVLNELLSDLKKLKE